MSTPSDSNEPPPNHPWLAQYYSNDDAEGTDATDALLSPGGTGAAPEDRYEIVGEVGEGGMKTVWRAHDPNTNRDVAMAVGRNDGADEERRFLREARITAALEHPNIVPIYDLGRNESGEPFFVMRLLGGETLGDILSRIQKEPDDCQLRFSLPRLLEIFLRVCDTIAYAHSQGVVHLDIKPANIQVSDYGEVLVLDWGLAKISPDEPAPNNPDDATPKKQSSSAIQWPASVIEMGNEAIRGTPGFMAPEQQRGNLTEVDERADVFALGAVLHTLLTGAPGTSNDADKRSHQAPPPLLAITEKACADATAERYGSVVDLATDVRHFLDDRAVSAYQDSLSGFAKRWYRRHRLHFWAAALIAIVTVTFSVALYRLKLREIASWGQPVLVERFDSPDWKDRWTVISGQPEHRNGRLETVYTKGYGMRMRCNQLLDGDAAIEFDGEILANAAPGDLSAIWWPVDGILNNRRTDEIVFQTGAHGNSYATIVAKPKRLAFRNVRLEPGRRYRIRAEIEDHRLRLYIDGEVQLEYRVDVPPGPGYFGLYGFYAGKAFDNVHVYQKGTPEQVSATALGDALFRRRHYAEALPAFQRVVQTHPGKRIGREALYKAGLCQRQLGNEEAAHSTWQQLVGTDYDRQARGQLAERAFVRGEHEEALRILEALYNEGNGIEKSAVAVRWSEFILTFQQASQREPMSKYVAFWKRHLERESVSAPAVYHALNKLDRLSEVPTLLAHEPYYAARALRKLQHYDALLQQFPQQQEVCASALFRAQRYEDILEKYPAQRHYCAAALVLLGKPERALAEYPEQVNIGVAALAALERSDEIPSRFPGWTRFWGLNDFKNSILAQYWQTAADAVAQIRD